MSVPVHRRILGRVLRDQIRGLDLAVGARKVQRHVIYHVGLQFLRRGGGAQK
jgi:hypothetical protein